MRKMPNSDKLSATNVTPGFPSQYQNDPRVCGFYYVLPQYFLRNLQRDPKVRERLDPVTLKLDVDLTECTDDLRLAVGFHNRIPIQYHLLTKSPLELDDPSLPDFFGMTPDQISSNFKVLQRELETANTAARAYNGWLLSNIFFVAQHRILIDRGKKFIEATGFPKPVVSRSDAGDTPLPLVKADRDRAKKLWLGEILDFYKHWRLTGMAGPYLPLPIQQHTPSFAHGLSENEYRGDTAAMSLPSIAPTHEGAELREMAERLSNRKRSPDHLKPWMEIVENANKQRAVQIESFERRFRIAHFWRVFVSRYGTHLTGIQERVGAIFADHLKIDFRTLGRTITTLKRSGLIVEAN